MEQCRIFSTLGTQLPHSAQVGPSYQPRRTQRLAMLGVLQQRVAQCRDLVAVDVAVTEPPPRLPAVAIKHGVAHEDIAAQVLLDSVRTSRACR